MKQKWYLTLWGFVLMLYGYLWWPLISPAIRWMIRESGWRDKVGRFVISQAGWIRNGLWECRNEIYEAHP